MDKVFRRTALAVNQAKRRAKVAIEKENRRLRKQAISERARYQQSILRNEKQERQQRREDWMMGPLAPRRDAGERYDAFGTVSLDRIQLPTVFKGNRRRYINFAVGDRAVVIRGQDKGKISKIVSIMEPQQSVRLKDLNMHDVETPDWVQSGESDRRPFHTQSLPYSMDDIRLVAPLVNRETGKVEDMIIDAMVGGGPFLEIPYPSEEAKLHRHTRYIIGTDQEIPWPEPPVESTEDQPVDTLRIQVEEHTFNPSLKSYPFPSPTIIDELRNKYSVFRTRHDPEYLERKHEEDIRAAWRKSRTLMTPKAEYLARQAEQKRLEREQRKDEEGNVVLPEATVSFIERYLTNKATGKQ